jgi:LysR family nitrogen assimilation transcriptional regulator
MCLLHYHAGMDLKQLDILAKVAAAGSLSRAAAHLHIGQPALSRQIAALEKSVGQALLTRTGRGVELTPAGTLLLGHAHALLDHAERARADLRELQASPRGRVVVGLPPRIAHVVTADLVLRFRTRFPDAVITVVEGLSLALREWLIAGRIDLALLFDPAPAAQLYFETLRRESLVLVAPPGSRPLPTRVSLAALADHPLILPASPNALRHLVDDAARARGLALDVSVEVDSVHTVLSLVARGVGWSVLPESAMDAATLARGMQMAHIGPPAIRNRLVLAVPRARPATRLLRESAALLKSIGAPAAGRETPPASAKTRAR